MRKKLSHDHLFDWRVEIHVQKGEATTTNNNNNNASSVTCGRKQKARHGHAGGVGRRTCDAKRRRRWWWWWLMTAPSSTHALSRVYENLNYKQTVRTIYGLCLCVLACRDQGPGRRRRRRRSRRRNRAQDNRWCWWWCGNLQRRGHTRAWSGRAVALLHRAIIIKFRVRVRVQVNCMLMCHIPRHYWQTCS